VELLQYILLGIIQGLTEFLPVSSSGHLVLAEHWLSLNPPGVVVEVALHLATLVSVVVVYFRDLVAIIRERQWLFIGYITLGTIVTVAIVLPLRDLLAWLTEAPFAVALVGAMLWLTGGWMVLADVTLRRSQQRGRLGWARAAAVGLAQAVAAVPGISRSGATIGTAVQLGIPREQAARFSFILSLPVILGAGVLTLGDVPQAVASGGLNPLGLALAFIAALVSGIAAIYLVLWLLRRARLVYFGVYCFVLGTVALALGSGGG
jgi:undecaprenyl-diphosphatase